MGQIEAYGYYLTEVNQPLEKRAFTPRQPEKDEVIVKVAGCGLCHTDIGFISGQVKTNTALPLILGHEISGTVVETGSDFDNLLQKNVLIPAVLPCGECELCKTGRSNVCRSQKMPGNDFNGGFASHITVPARFVCELPQDLGTYTLPQLSVISDAVTTPYQSFKRSTLEKGELAIVIGVGGIGVYMSQFASACGATVIAIDIDDKKLAKVQELGAQFTINSKGLSDRDIKNRVRTLVKENTLPKFKWKVFETSGTAIGQTTAFSLLSFAGTIGIVGFTMDKITIRLSNAMAFDADIFGNWGCKPEYYPTVVSKVLSKEINVVDNIEEHSLDSINEIVPLSMQHKIEKRVIFKP